MDILLQFLIVLLAARGLGEVAVRFGQSASVGELLAGVALAALAGLLDGAVPAVGDLAASPALGYAAQAGVFFLVLLAGIEMKPRELARASGGAVAVALGGMVLPLAAGIGLGLLFLPDTPDTPVLALVIGVSMAITAIPATVRVFSDFGLLHTRAGEIVVSAAIFDDVLGMVLLTVVIVVVQTGQPPDLISLLIILAKAAAFFAITIILGVHLYPRISRGIQKLQAATIELSAMVMVGLGYGWLAEVLGLHWILGAFMAGLYFESPRVGRRAYRDLRLIVTALTSALLGPVFFAWIGLQVDIKAFSAAPVFLAILIVVAFAGKVIGAGSPARVVGLDRRESLIVGVGMTSRGAIELVVLGIMLEAGLFARGHADAPIISQLFSILVIMATANTLLTPIALRWLVRRPRADGE